MVSLCAFRIENNLTCHRSPVCMRCFRRVIDMTEDTRERGHQVTLSQSAPTTRNKKRKHDERDEPDQIHYFQRIRVLCKQSKSFITPAPNPLKKYEGVVPGVNSAKLWFVIRARLMFNGTYQ